MSETSVPGGLDTAAAWAWRILVVAAAVLALGYLLVTLRLVVLPIIVATLISTALIPPTRWLRDRGWPRLASAGAVFVGFLVALVGLGLLIVPPTVDEFSGLGDTLEEGIDDIESWLIDGPLDLEQRQIDDARERASDAFSEGFESDQVVEGAVLIGEIFAGALLSLVLLFFFVKDGDKFQRAALEVVPERHHGWLKDAARAAWTTLGGYLRGVALLGFVESVIIGLTLVIVGADLILPVMLITVVGAFFPLVGAVTAGVVAVLVALVTAGPGAALIVAIVAILVQQFDNDLLAPFIYGRALRLHPVVILVALTGGAAVGGIVGAFLGVPVAAVTLNVIRALRERDQPSAKSATSGA
jgi:predicted PurR-regulated permease PerM